MYKYYYEEVRFDGIFMKSRTDYKKIIDKYAQAGCRFVGFVPKIIENNGRIVVADLVFEKKIDD